MSSALAVSGVTAVIQYLLNNSYNSADSVLGGVTVMAQAPDLVQNKITSGADSGLLVNVFLHQVTLNAALRNVGLPSLAADGQTLLKNPPLALDLHYLVTAYASKDTEADALLGYAVQVLHENPVVPRAQIVTALNSVPPATNPLAAALKNTGLANQIEMIKIVPETLGREEIAWLWTALKADYRPTFPFQVSVVLILSPAPAFAAPRVLQRSLAVQAGFGTAYPSISAVTPPASQPAACLGDTISVQGLNLQSATQVLISNPLIPVQRTITPTNLTATGLQFTLLPEPPILPAGIYSLTVQAPGPQGSVTTNSLPLMIAPKITSAMPPTVPAGATALTVDCVPAVQPTQNVTLLIGGQAAVSTPPPPTTATSSPSFTFSDLQTTSQAVPVWLRVDGVDGPTIDFTPLPPLPPKFAQPLTQVT
jgi:Pvc16 N-terminal domain/IPT/TIG domain